MPGFFGLIGTASSEGARARLEAMARCSAYDPALIVGSETSCDLKLSIGWTAHPGSFAASMPLWNARHNVASVITGELFAPDTPSPADRSPQGHALLRLYERHGTSFVRSLNGWFSGLLMDHRSKEVLLFNDRYGLARIYVYETSDSLYFASEAKSLLSILSQLRGFDPGGIQDYWTCGCVLDGRTLFKGLTLLPPGSLWRVRPNGTVNKERYFRPSEWEQQAPADPDSYYSELRDTFRRILPRYFEGSQPVGISLTGGVDSRLIMAWGPADRQTPCYSFGGPYRECRDVKIGRSVAQACGLPHRVISIGDDFIKSFPQLAAKTAYVSDGTMDASGAVELYVNNLARQIAPVRLTGNYGGEILRSTVAFGPRALSPLPFAPELRSGFSQSAERYRSHRSGHPLSFIAFKQVPWHHYSRLSIEQSQVTLRSPFLDNELVKHVFCAPSSISIGKDVSLRLIREGRPCLRGIPTDRGLRAEPRPLIDRLHQKFLAATVKAEYAYDYGMPQWFVGIDRLLQPLHLERAFLGHHKFYHFRYWYRHVFGGFLRDTLLDSRALARSHFDSRGLKQLVNDHVHGRANYTMELHRLLSLELMHRQLIDQP